MFGVYLGTLVMMLTQLQLPSVTEGLRWCIRE